MSAEILIVDDNSDIRNIINELIQDAGYKTRIAANYNQALAEIDKKLPDVAILDVKLDKGDNDGIELLSHIKTKNKDVPVIIISGHANIEMAIKSLHYGAFEFIEKPFDQERLLNFVSRAVENFNLKTQNKEYENKLFSSYQLIGDSKNTFSVLNGALLDSNKYELELFGEEKENGSISYGALEKANMGTLLIDQISEIPLDIQSKILRVLTDQKFKRVNGNSDVSVDVRLICSSSKDLKKGIQIGNFREDLFHRINVFEINIEPLSQRISDIPLLIKYFSKKISENYNIKELEIDENNSYILNHSWKGNVRELRNLIERIAILQPDTKDKISNIIKESLKNDNFDDQIAENSLSVPLKEAREKFEKEYLTIQLKKFNGNISKTANFVGMERSALHRKLKGLGIKEFN